jgi:uncharacterized protein YhfF
MEAVAWILDRAHRAQRLSCNVAPGERALEAVRARALDALGLALGVPIGVRAVEAAPELLFVVSEPVSGGGWPPLATWAAADDRGFALYVEAMLGGWAPPTRALDVFHFGDAPELAARLGHLVVKGVKRGTTGWVAAAERDGSAIPAAGLVSIVTDGFGYPLCAIHTERVEHLRFAEVTAAHAEAEAEGDRTLESWREGHRRYFEREAARLGLVFSDDAVVFFEHFRVLAVLGRADP